MLQHPRDGTYGAPGELSSPFELRAGLRCVTESQRERECGVNTCRLEGPGIEVTGRRGAWTKTRWIGVSTCGHIWTCPVCSRKLRAARLARLTHALRMSGATWQMVTLTVRHRDGMPLKSLLAGLMKAWRATRQGGAIQRIWSERVSASARATEVTRGSNGWHPHLHVLLRTHGWTDEEREALLERWLRCVERELGPACVPSSEHALRWSTPIDVCSASEVDRAAYLAKLGLELAGPKGGHRGSLTAWQIARAAAEGDEQCVAWWREYTRATRGRRMIELDDRAVQFAKIPLPDESSGDFEAPTRVVVSIDPLELRALREYERRVDRGIMGAILGSLATVSEPREAVEAWLALVTSRLGYARRNDAPPPDYFASSRWHHECTGPP